MGSNAVFLCCGSSTGVDLCLERTGTGVVVRVVVRGKSGNVLPHFGVSIAGVEEWLPIETGLRGVTSTVWCPSSSRAVVCNRERTKIFFGIPNHVGWNTSMR